MVLEKDNYYLVQVVKLIKSGAIVELDDGSTQLVHVSQIASKYVSDPSKFLEEGVYYSAKCIEGQSKDGSGLCLSFKYLNMGPKFLAETKEQHVNTTDGRKPSLDEMIESANRTYNDKFMSKGGYNKGSKPGKRRTGFHTHQEV